MVVIVCLFKDAGHLHAHVSWTDNVQGLTLANTHTSQECAAQNTLLDCCKVYMHNFPHKHLCEYRIYSEQLLTRFRKAAKAT